jgi:hypothetical protein
MMTSISDAANIVSFFAGAAALVGLVHLLHAQSVDELRSRLFSLRDEMFLYALDHGLLSNPAYCELRNEMNGLIRYGHKLTITQVLILTITSKFYSVERFLTPTWTAHLNTLSDEDQKVLLSFDDKQKPIVITYLAYRSIVLHILMRIATLYLKITNQSGRKENVVKLMSSHLPWRSLENEAACV